MPGTTPRRSISERVERSIVGQLLIASGVVLYLMLQVGTHLPVDSALHQKYSPDANRYIRWIGAEQAWGVFAPNPRNTSLDMEARITFVDGSTAVWELPHGPNIGANLRFYRWRKWLERVRSDDYRSLWEPTAAWVASLYEGGPSPVARVELVRRFRRNSVLDPQPPYEEYTFFTYDLPEDAS